MNSWPAFIPITFELTVLFAAGSIVLSFLWTTGLPRLNHPAFEIENFERASDDLFFVVADIDDDALAAQAVVREFGLKVTP